MGLIILSVMSAALLVVGVVKLVRARQEEFPSTLTPTGEPTPPTHFDLTLPDETSILAPAPEPKHLWYSLNGLNEPEGEIVESEYAPTDGVYSEWENEHSCLVYLGEF